MLPLDVPLTPDPDYVRFLADREAALCSVHFSLYDPAVADARQRMEKKDATDVVACLNLLPSTPKYVLMNARVHAPDKYFSDTSLGETGERLALLADNADLNGLIFSDAYYLQALSDAHPDLARRLEAVPSINTMIDSAEQAFAVLDTVAATGFRPPSRLVLDRSLNRDTARLEDTARRIRSAHPTMKLLLIANEGCLYRCPYKLSHDAHIAMVNEDLCAERTFAINHDFGCVRRLLSDPGAMLASPFIRPEDAARYDGVVDGIKLCGRNRGTAFLIRAVTAYLAGTYEGNLLDLMDAMGDLAHRVELPNHRLPASFHDRVTTCDKRCGPCGWCADRAGAIVERREPGPA